MERLAIAVERHKKIILICFIAAMLASILLAFTVDVEYDMSTYLPEDAETRVAIELLQQEFGYPGIAQVMVSDISLSEAMEVKARIVSVAGVDNVVWLDDVLDIKKPLNTYPGEQVEAYYKDGSALFQVEFAQNGYAQQTGEAIDSIREVLKDYEVNMGGEAVASKTVRDTTGSEIALASLICVGIVLVILVLGSRSFLEPLLYLLVIGAAILINMGTNVIFGRISYMTNSVQALLQLAVSIDYSLFLYHRIQEGRESGLPVEQAVVQAVRHSTSAVMASALTTIAGFAALCFMRYGIGTDMGLVLAKGVVFSLISVIFLMPVLYLYGYKLLDKFSHRRLMPSFKRAGKRLLHVRYLVVPLLLIIAVPMFLAQRSNAFIYGEEAVLNDSPAQREQARIDDTFGYSDRIVVLLPREGIAKETQLSDTLLEKDYVSSVQALCTVADPELPQDLIPESVREVFQTGQYSRMILLTDIGEENARNFAAEQDLEDTIASYYEDFQLAGTLPGVSDIKEIVEADYPVVNWISIAAVMLIILLTFKNACLPFLLTLIIEVSIWINMGIPYFQGTSLSFLGYMIVSSIQLGATIDYAILMTDRYMGFRAVMNKREAIGAAVEQSAASILTSALILGTAGLALGFISSTASVSEMGILIGRGALLSGGIVLVALPQFLYIFDTPIRKARIGKRSERTYESKQKRAKSQ